MSAVERKIYFLYNLHRYEIEYYALLEGPADADIKALEEEFSARYELNWFSFERCNPAQYKLASDRLLAEAIERGWTPKERPILSEECFFLEWLKAEKGFAVPDPRRAVIQEFRRT